MPGHIFQGRYKAMLVEKDTYLLELSRYIHLNPFRAGVGDTENRPKNDSLRRPKTGMRTDPGKKQARDISLD